MQLCFFLSTFRYHQKHVTLKKGQARFNKETHLIKVHPEISILKILSSGSETKILQPTILDP